MVAVDNNDPRNPQYYKARDHFAGSPSSPETILKPCTGLAGEWPELYTRSDGENGQTNRARADKQRSPRFLDALVDFSLVGEEPAYSEASYRKD